MRYSAIVLVLVINVAFVKAAVGDQGAGYTYQINARRVSQTIAPSYPILYMYYQVSPNQNITYFVELNSGNPLLLEAWIDSGGNTYFQNDDGNLVSTCDSFDNGTWEYVLAEVIKKGIIPGGSCNIKKGNYMVSDTVAPVTVTFPQMIVCGEYWMVTNFYVRDAPSTNLIWGGQLEFLFEIPDDGRCIQS